MCFIYTLLFNIGRTFGFGTFWNELCVAADLLPLPKKYFSQIPDSDFAAALTFSAHSASLAALLQTSIGFQCS